MALGAMMGTALKNGLMNQGQSPGTPATPGQGKQQPQEQARAEDPFLAMVKRHLGAPPPPLPPIANSGPNPGYDGASGGTA